MTMVVTAHDRLAGSILVLSQASPGWAPDGQTLPSGPCQARPEPVAMARFRDLQKMFSDCMRHRRALRPEMSAKNPPVAQLDRGLNYESRGQEFESLRARHLRTKPRTFPFAFCLPAMTAACRTSLLPIVLMALSSTSMASTIERM